MPRKHPEVREMTARERAIQKERVARSIVTARYGVSGKGHNVRYNRAALAAMGEHRS